MFYSEITTVWLDETLVGQFLCIFKISVFWVPTCQPKIIHFLGFYGTYQYDVLYVSMMAEKGHTNAKATMEASPPQAGTYILEYKRQLSANKVVHM